MEIRIRNSYKPKVGEYCNTVVIDKETGVQYLFDENGVYTELAGGDVSEVLERAKAYTDRVAAGKVDKVEGKELSTNDFTDALKDKLDGVEAGAEANKINVIKRNGVTLPITNKTVDIAVPTKTSDLTNDSHFATTTYVDAADQNLQEQIDAISAASDVVDIVGTYADLQNYDTSSLGENDIIKVLTDESRGGATTYYRWSNNTFTYVGSEGPYYTKSEADSTFVPQTRTVNNKALSSNITLTAQDVGAATPADIPTAVSELTNDSGYITSAALTSYYTKTETDNLLDDKQDNLVAGTGIDITNNVISTTVAPTTFSYSNGTLFINNQQESA